MQSQLPILIIITPLLFAFINAVVGWFRPVYSVFITILAMALSFYFSVQMLALVISDGTIEYVLSGWTAPYGIEYVVDHLNGMVLVVVSFVALLVAIYSKRGVDKELGDKVAHFYTLFLLLTTGLLGITITVRIDDKRFLVHALTKDTSVGIPGKMQTKIASIFKKGKK